MKTRIADATATVNDICPSESERADSIAYRWELQKTRLEPEDLASKILPIVRNFRQEKNLAATGIKNPKRTSELLAPVFQLQQELSSRIDPRFAIFECLLDENQYQSARYDGDLQGTEVGMILFYTDLLAKIWTIEFNDSHPKDSVPGFVTDFSRRLSPIFWAENSELSSVRLWFGHDDSGFGLVRDTLGEALAIQRVATRIYSAGSKPYIPG